MKFCFQSSDNTFVDSVAKAEKNDSHVLISNVIFGAVFKNRNKGSNNSSCENGHMEPKYQCDSQPWL